MSKFRAKTTTVEAEQWWPGGLIIAGVHLGEVPIYAHVVEGTNGVLIGKLPPPGRDHAWLVDGSRFALVNPGDWIVTFEDRRRVLMEPAAFERAFEEVP